MKTALVICALIAFAICATAQSNTWYVSQDSPTNGPGTNWNTAFQDIQSAIDAATAGDTVLVTDGVYSTGARVVTGVISNRVVIDKAVTVESSNGPGATEIEGGTETRCVFLTNGASLFGFTLNGGNASQQTSQLTPDLSGGGAYCTAITALLSNCVLSGNTAGGESEFDDGFGGGAYGGTLFNCTLTGNTGNSQGGGACGATLSNCVVNGNFTDVDGGGVYQCTLSNCTLSRNISVYWGGGAYGGTLSECLIFGNNAQNSGGGGAEKCTLNNCLVVGNGGYGTGGADNCTLSNCTVVNNSTSASTPLFGAGGCSGTAYNCIIYDNFAPSLYPDSVSNTTAACNYCCTAPLPGSGVGNILGPPGFVNETDVIYATNGNYMLQSNSPCINAGNNVYVTAAADLAGNPRIVGGTVDIGAYEYQTPTSLISSAWLQQYGFPTDGSSDFLDPDGDGMNNYQEWIAGTDPTNAASVLEMISVVATNAPPGLVVTWQSVNARTYYLQSSSNLTALPSFMTLQTNLPGLTNTTSYVDTNATGPGPYFYRVGVSGFP